MPSGSPARWLAPTALAVALLAVVVLVLSSMGGDSETPPAASQESTGRTGTSTAPRTRTGEDEPERPRTGTTATTATTPAGGRKTYTVQTGDTFGSIAEETGVSIEELQTLNPTVDPQALTVGQDIRLAR